MMKTPRVKLVLFAALAAISMFATAAGKASTKGKAKVAKPDKAGVTEVAIVRFGGNDTIATALEACGQMLGNEIISQILGSAYEENPLAKLFGPTRDGADITMLSFADSSAKGSDAFEKQVPVLIYPTRATKAKFLAHYSNAVETNGYIRINNDEMPGYVLFSKDNQWLAFSEKSDLLKTALSPKRLDLAAKPIGSDIATIKVTPQGMKIIRKALTEQSSREEFSQVDSLTFGLGFDKNGISVWATMKPLAGSKLASYGKTPVKPSTLEEIGARAFIAQASGESPEGFDAYACWQHISTLLTKHGIKLPFLSCTKSGECLKYVADATALVAYLSSDEGSSAIEKADYDKFFEELKAYSTKLQADNKNAKMLPVGSSWTLELKDVAPRVSASARFRAILPEANGKPLSAQFVAAPGSILRSLIAAAVMSEKTPREEKAVFQLLLPFIQNETTGGVAGAIWRDKNGFSMRMRISADEIKFLSGIWLGLAMMNQGIEEGEEDGADE